MQNNNSFKKIATNRKAFHEYFVDDKYEAGIQLLGTEVKSIKQGNVSLVGSYADLLNGEIFLHGMNVATYEQGNIFNHEPTRKRKLLLHFSEIRKIDQNISRKGYTLIPLNVYLKRGLVKIEIGLCRGKRDYDKRESIKKKTAEADIRRQLANRR